MSFSVNLAMAAPTLFIFFFLVHLLLLNSAESTTCPRSFPCQNLGSLEFPLSNMQPECGLFTVNCTSPNPILKLDSGNTYYEVLEKISSDKLFVRDPFLQRYLLEKNCFAFSYRSLPRTPSSSFTISPSLTMYPCINSSHAEICRNEHFVNYSCSEYTVHYRNSTNNLSDNEIIIPEGCWKSQMPIKSDQDPDDLLELLSANFTLQWNITDDCMRCHESGGQCSTNNMNEFLCRREKSSRNLILAAGTKGVTEIAGGAIAATLLIIGVFLAVFMWKNRTVQKEAEGVRGKCISFRLHKSKTESHMDIELFLRNNENLAPKRYKNSDLKKITNSFSNRIGKGGFGSVYKGKLQDDRLVAVKILNESKGNGEEFMNEVASISRTSHINIVTLLGFCFESSRRALVYEFMPNGSLEKFLHNSISSTEEGRLGWEKLFEIAIGIARGLEYLHQGCNTRILHLDIKPPNILLDKDLIPKISDFGLSKLCPDRASMIMSMVGARGTVGYIAPEIFCRNFGDVSHKSDVYSFGMLVLEMVGGRENVDARAECSSDIYFPDWIYKKLEVSADDIGDEDEGQFVKRKLTIIGLWCIQTDPNQRPSVSRVVEMLEGNLESFPIPPRPYLFSPAKFQVADQDFTFESSS